jgi:hypothetical protein
MPRSLAAADGAESHSALPPSFRDISRDYLNREARNNFLIEAALFAMIVITAALPLLNGAHALAGLVRSLGVL